MIAPTFLNQHRGRGLHEQADVNISPPQFLFRLCSGVPALKPLQGGSSARQQQSRIGGEEGGKRTSPRDLAIPRHESG